MLTCDFQSDILPTPKPQVAEVSFLKTQVSKESLLKPEVGNVNRPQTTGR
jgi:hypothetical protein